MATYKFTILYYPKLSHRITHARVCFSLFAPNDFYQALFIFTACIMTVSTPLFSLSATHNGTYNINKHNRGIKQLEFFPRPGCQVFETLFTQNRSFAKSVNHFSVFSSNSCKLQSVNGYYKCIRKYSFRLIIPCVYCAKRI